MEIVAVQVGNMHQALDENILEFHEETEGGDTRNDAIEFFAQPGLHVLALEPSDYVTGSVIGAAFFQAWRNFIGLVAFLVQALGVVLPQAALAYLGWVLGRRFGGKRG